MKSRLSKKAKFLEAAGLINIRARLRKQVCSQFLVHGAKATHDLHSVLMEGFSLYALPSSNALHSLHDGVRFPHHPCSAPVPDISGLFSDTGTYAGVSTVSPSSRCRGHMCTYVFQRPHCLRLFHVLGHLSRL